MKPLKMYLKVIVIPTSIMIVLEGCSSSNSLLKNSTVSFMAGVAGGGVVENNTLEGVNGISGVDAITGATRTGFNAGVHKEMNFNGLTFESGLDYLTFGQTVTYDMPSFSLNGKRDLQFHQLRLPLTANFQFFKSYSGYARLIVKAGFSAGYTIYKSVSDAGKLSQYTLNKWDYGPTLGFAVYPFSTRKNYRIGLYMDLYRGSRIYKDYYHTAEGMGGQSYLKVGIVVQR